MVHTTSTIFWNNTGKLTIPSNIDCYFFGLFGRAEVYIMMEKVASWSLLINC
jgi:hypothetical protein